MQKTRNHTHKPSLKKTYVGHSKSDAKKKDEAKGAGITRTPNAATEKGPESLGRETAGNVPRVGQHWEDIAGGEARVEFPIEVRLKLRRKRVISPRRVAGRHGVDIAG